MKKILKYFNGIYLFFREMLVNPASVGAVTPSSRQLGQKMAEQIPAGQNGLVIELGAGTGAITQSLLKNGVSQERLIIVERSEALCRHLRERFPQLKIIHGDAQDLQTLLQDLPKPVNAIISGLPLLSLPADIVSNIENAVKSCLVDDGVFIQFTYDLRKNAPVQLPHFKRLYSKYVWMNFPPAKVDVYAR